MSDWQYCKKVIKKYGGKYYIATRFFPKQTRYAIYALYAWVRKLDNIVDETPNKLQAKEDFDKWVHDWRKAESEEQSKRPEMRAFLKIIKKFSVDQKHRESFIRAMSMDLEKKEYETLAELEEYMYGSATVVGLMIVQIIGGTKEEALPYAKALAEAMQLTNFLRDIKNDWVVRERIYMPREELTRYELDTHDIQNNRLCRPFVQFKIAQARKLFAKAEEGMHLLPQKAKFPIFLSGRLYGAILDQIERQNYDVFIKRAGTTFWQKFIITITAYVWYRKNMS